MLVWLLIKHSLIAGYELLIIVLYRIVLVILFLYHNFYFISFDLFYVFLYVYYMQLVTSDPKHRDLLPSLEQLKEFNAKRRLKGAVQAVRRYMYIYVYVYVYVYVYITIISR